MIFVLLCLFFNLFFLGINKAEGGLFGFVLEASVCHLSELFCTAKEDVYVQEAWKILQGNNNHHKNISSKNVLKNVLSTQSLNLNLKSESTKNVPGNVLSSRSVYQNAESTKMENQKKFNIENSKIMKSSDNNSFDLTNSTNSSWTVSTEIKQLLLFFINRSVSTPLHFLNFLQDSLLQFIKFLPTSHEEFVDLDSRILNENENENKNKNKNKNESINKNDSKNDNNNKNENNTKNNTGNKNKIKNENDIKYGYSSTSPDENETDVSTDERTLFSSIKELTIFMESKWKREKEEKLRLENEKKEIDNKLPIMTLINNLISSFPDRCKCFRGDKYDNRNYYQLQKNQITRKKENKNENKNENESNMRMKKFEPYFHFLICAKQMNEEDKSKFKSQFKSQINNFTVHISIPLFSKVKVTDLRPVSTDSKKEKKEKIIAYEAKNKNKSVDKNRTKKIEHSNKYVTEEQECFFNLIESVTFVENDRIAESEEHSSLGEKSHGMFLARQKVLEERKERLISEIVNVILYTMNTSF